MHVMHCRDCGHEYRLGFVRCPECQTDLSPGPAPKADRRFDPDKAQALLATMPVAEFTTLPMNEALRMRDSLLSQQILAGLIPATGGCDPTGCATNFTVVVPTDQIESLKERFGAIHQQLAGGRRPSASPHDAAVAAATAYASARSPVKGGATVTKTPRAPLSDMQGLASNLPSASSMR